jgi:hypothetical protein
LTTSGFLFPATISLGDGGGEVKMKQRLYVDKKEIEGKIFFYKNFGKGYHGKVNFRLWINKQVIKFDDNNKEYIELPCENARIVKTEKGNLVLRPCEGWYVFDVGVKCGFRGESDFEILDPKDCEIFRYVIFDSPLGSIGVSKYGLVSTTSTKITLRWWRSGRLYGKPNKGIIIIHLDGKEEDFPDQDGLEALKEIEELTQ